MDKTSPCNTCTRSKDPEGCAMFRRCPDYIAWMCNDGWPSAGGKKATPPRAVKRDPGERTCIVCGKPLPLHAQFYCSKTCRNSARETGMSRPCCNCGKPIPKDRPHSRYCCELCRLQAKAKHEREVAEQNRKCYLD